MKIVNKLPKKKIETYYVSRPAALLTIDTTTDTCTANSSTTDTLSPTTTHVF